MQRLCAGFAFLISLLGVLLASPQARAEVCDTLEHPLLSSEGQVLAEWTLHYACAEKRFEALSRACVVGATSLPSSASNWSDEPEVRTSEIVEDREKANLLIVGAELLEWEAARRDAQVASGDRDPSTLAVERTSEEAARQLDAVASVETHPTYSPAKPDGDSSSELDPGPDLTCQRAELETLDQIYGRLFAHIHEIPGRLPQEALCDILVHGAAVRDWMDLPGAKARLSYAASLQGAPCGGILSPLLADASLAELHVAIDSERSTLRGALVSWPRDGATWYLDGAGVPMGGGGPLLSSPGWHRVERVDERGDVAWLVFSIDDQSEAVLSYEEGQIFVASGDAPWLGDGGDVRIQPQTTMELVVVGAVTGVTWHHKNFFGVAGAGLLLPFGPEAQVGLRARALLSFSAWPVYLSRWEATHMLPSSDILLEWSPHRDGLAPRVALGATGMAPVSLGPYAEAGFEIPVSTWVLNFRIGVPYYMLGDRMGGVTATLTINERRLGGGRGLP